MRLEPGPHHPITVTAAPVRVVVRAGGAVVADSRAALVLREADYPISYYIPRDDVDLGGMKRTAHQSYCPFKGEASYFSIPTLGEDGINAAWTYEAPFDAVAPIKDHVAFYTNRVDSVAELPL